MSFRIINADVMDGLKSLSDESVQCCVTSPPYFGLRDYGTGTWEGGNAECDHMDPSGVGNTPSDKSTLTTNGGKGPQAGDKYSASAKTAQYRDVCGKCCAKRIDRQIGLEPTPDAFVARLVEVFREVRRVLRKDGTCWVNLGDSYAGGGGHSPSAPSSKTSKSGLYGDALKQGGIKPVGVIKAKDMIGIPWRVAFALQADGWYLRSDIIWHKPNPMPESVTDRPTKSHEYLFLLTKSERYYYDAEAVAEPLSECNAQRTTSSYETFGRGPVDGGNKGLNTLAAKMRAGEHTTRNKRTVWTIATAPFSEAHFATFPPELPEICIKAGTKPGDTVLDPFSGAGTTAMVADRLQRNAIGIELNPEYARMSEARLSRDRGGLLDLMEAAE